MGQKISKILRPTKEYDLNQVTQNTRTTEDIINEYADRYASYIEGAIIMDRQDFARDVNGQGHVTWFNYEHMEKKEGICEEFKNTMEQVLKNNNIKNFILTNEKSWLDNHCKISIKKSIPSIVSNDHNNDNGIHGS